MRNWAHRLLSPRNLIARSKGKKASPCEVSYQLSKYAHNTANDWSIILLNLHNNRKFRFPKGDWVEALDQLRSRRHFVRPVLVGLGNSGVIAWPVTAGLGVNGLKFTLFQ